MSAIAIRAIVGLLTMIESGVMAKEFDVFAKVDLDDHKIILDGEVAKLQYTPLGNIHTGLPMCSETWVGLTLISVFHHLAQLPSRFCQIPISPSRVGQTVEHFKS